MFNKERYRSLERTLVIDSRIRNVTQFQNVVVKRQTTAVAVPTNANYNTLSLIVGPTGYALPATKGLLYIDVAQPIKMQIGETLLDIVGQFTISGTVPPVVLLSDTEQAVNVIQY